MPYTMEDFQRQFVRDHFPKLTREEQQDVIQSLPPEEQQAAIQSLPPEVRLAGLTVEQIREHLDRLAAEPPPRKPRRKR